MTENFSDFTKQVNNCFHTFTVTYINLQYIGHRRSPTLQACRCTVFLVIISFNLNRKNPFEVRFLIPDFIIILTTKLLGDDRTPPKFRRHSFLPRDATQSAVMPQ